MAKVVQPQRFTDQLMVGLSAMELRDAQPIHIELSPCHRCKSLKALHCHGDSGFSFITRYELLLGMNAS